MINLSLTLLSFVLYLQFERVFTATQSFFNEDLMVVEGDNCNSSEIKSMLVDRNVSKIHVYLTHTFYLDEDLKLNGITELQMFANTWHCTHPVTIDVSGSNGVSQESPKVKGSSGSTGNDGKNGGSFLGLTNRTINCDYLTVISNGGNGSDGQAGAASDDVYVLLDVESDAGDSSGDLQNYYKKYFADRGYDAELSDIDDYTSFYAVFVHDKKASFNIRLHPRKCCGKTGVGGPGGHGGRRGEFVFKHLGKSRRNDKSETTPAFVGNDGSIGKVGKNGEICETKALDVRIDVELKKVVFIFLPLHHTFSSKFTALNHTNSSKCSPEYMRSVETTVVEQVEPHEVDVASSIVTYKIFLLENMKNESRKSMAHEMYKAIDDNWDVNNKQNSLRGLLLEACELEKRYSELKETINVTSIYKRLYDRAENSAYSREDGDEERARRRLRSILELKLNDLDTDYNLIVNLELYTEVAILTLNIRSRRLPSMTPLNDVELQNRLNRLQFEVNGNFILAEYDHVIKGFQLTYFPFAVEYLDNFAMPTPPSVYENLDDIHTTAINKIKAVNETINRIKYRNMEIMMNLNYVDYSSPMHAFFIWKNSDIRDEIRKLFAGEKITLLADVKQARRMYNAMKFNTIDLLFRSSEQNVNDELNNVLNYYFNVELKHNGRSEYRCNNNFFQIITDPLSLFFSFEKDERNVPLTRVLTYDMLLNNQPTLSPYATWEIQIIPKRERDISRLADFARFPIDIELHGTGKFVAEDVPICENKDLLVKFYTQI